MTNHKEISTSITIDELRNLIKDISDKNQQLVININIEKVEMVIKELREVPLSLNFDKVDVKENKGNINFGNNFGIGAKEEQTSVHKPQKRVEDIRIKVNEQEVDYY